MDAIGIFHQIIRIFTMTTGIPSIPILCSNLQYNPDRELRSESKEERAYQIKSINDSGQLENKFTGKREKK